MYKVLIVEDEADIRNLIDETMKKRGYETFTAGDGYEALRLLSRTSADIVVSDIMMPHLDGLSLVKEIRKTSNIPVIFLSARNDDVDKIWGLGIGADDYVVKPVNINELVARIEAQLRRTKIYDGYCTIISENIQLGEFILDEDKCEITLDGKEIKLLAKEFKLLAYFLKNPDKVVTKKQLYKQVWDDEYYFDDNTITVTISRLRSKIENKDRKYIYTIRGLGYKFKVDVRIV
ncbi:DNA-binding response regulator, OmpR family, contains REC and winged-helix (wHTH) domain [Acetoanaerobium noterae]|uniref:Stage 0 sporulation protein A homolog n=1 Tax=Acetoanaerobium noterae TaxID=745369 RepID=A0A1T5D169_9FIRM|nr:response regulator transcription factor [Acetoanaerobium noterae]SKB65346.1 DNA-binding response regulator, OmpR family, contains REC and winged-helix (wHTH) domain [Acetoanaerobium noterae]